MDSIYIIPEIPLESKENASDDSSRKLVVVVHIDQYGDQEQVLLSKMMSAVKYDLNTDVFILKVANNESHSLTMLNNAYHNTLIFGVNPIDLGLKINLRPYQPARFEKSTIMLCDNLRVISASNEKKRTIWEQLQKMLLN